MNTQIQSSGVPFQPGLAAQTEYQSCIVRWNPFSKKNTALCYQFNTGESCKPIEVLPDACVDFLFQCNQRDSRLFVSGIQTSLSQFKLKENTTYFGFKPYSTKGMKHLSFNWSELVDSELTECDLDLGRDIAELIRRIAEVPTFEGRSKLIARFAQGELADEAYVSDFVEYSELEICQAQGNIRLEQLSDLTGYTDRWCRKCFKEASGISIKNYSSIMRFQNAARMLLSQKSASIADVASESGYFDQAHLTREFKRFSNDTPLHFRQAHAGAA